MFPPVLLDAEALPAASSTLPPRLAPELPNTDILPPVDDNAAPAVSVIEAPMPEVLLPADTVIVPPAPLVVEPVDS
ncbi:hypothetical protein THRCLA_21842 [Thraustotheca clavata]|uniref:Uncharacterized protein n=1 Tax=Thraustotheca clavata TaxID=74557 RepID=A0A1V9ZN42_9STRA|nr:hypothetical protein THRCLA_21842 [Thraustotheca clavata]